MSVVRASKGLEGLSFKEMLKLNAAVQAKLAQARVEEKAKLRERLENVAKDSGFSIDELFPGFRRVKSPKKPPLAAKYRHPHNHDLQWSGRGRKPSWIVDQLNKGVALDAFRI